MHGSSQDYDDDSTPTPIVPVVGMGATLCYPSDRYACTIVAVHGANKHEVHVQLDKVYGGRLFVPNPQAEIRVFTKRKNGDYVLKGGVLHQSPYLFLGERDSHACPEI